MAALCEDSGCHRRAVYWQLQRLGGAGLHNSGKAVGSAAGTQWEISGKQWETAGNSGNTMGKPQAEKCSAFCAKLNSKGVTLVSTEPHASWVHSNFVRCIITQRECGVMLMNSSEESAGQQAKFHPSHFASRT